MKSKFTSIALSFLIAFGLWYYVITTVSPGYKDTFYNIPVVKEGSGVLEDRNLIITYQSSDNVDVTVSGNRTDVNKVNSNNITNPSWWLNPSSSSVYHQLMPDWWTGMYPITYYFMGCYLRDHPLMFLLLSDMPHHTFSAAPFRKTEPADDMSDFHCLVPRK